MKKALLCREIIERLRKNNILKASETEKKNLAFAE